MIEKISKNEFTRMVVKYHYSKVLPKLNKVFLGDDELQAVVSLGWGVRPLHTIRRLFPSLGTQDYLEIGKLCVAESMGRNTESLFLSRVLEWVRANLPNVKVIFTWADGMLGKVGYIYQASNFLYGGYIWTDTYITAEGEKVHPRTTGKIGGRPSKEYQRANGWLHYRGKQFRYVYFLCSNGERKRLLRESTVDWSRDYPKAEDLCWKVLAGNAWVEACATPYMPDARGFNDNAEGAYQRSRQELLFGDVDAAEVSREIRPGTTGEGAGQFCVAALPTTEAA